MRLMLGDLKKRKEKKHWLSPNPWFVLQHSASFSVSAMEIMFVFQNNLESNLDMSTAQELF